MKLIRILYFSLTLVLLLNIPVSAEPGKARIFSEHLFKDSDGFYRITSNQDLPYTSFSINKGVLTLKGPDGVKSFGILTDLTIEKLQGVWFESTKTDTGETSTKITRRASDYDFETVELYHDEKTYYSTRKDDLGVGYKLIDSAIIHDDNSDYFYFVQSYTSNAVQYVDSYGDTFTEKKFSGEKLLEIPKNYKRREY